MTVQSQLKYGNWIRKKNLLLLGIAAASMGIICLLPLDTLLRVITVMLFAILLLSFLFPLYAYWMFSPRGGNVQDKIYNLIITHLGTHITGRILDIGSGNGILAIKIAQAYPNAQVIGVDYWGKDWEYSKFVCEENAKIANVAKRARFAKGDAAALEFADVSFDAVVSNLTFHEVKSAPHKCAVVLEALRVVKPGGVFAFVDYFYDSHYYGNASEFEKFLQSQNLAQVCLKPVSELIVLPKLLQHPKFLGKVGIVYGQR